MTIPRIRSPCRTNLGEAAARGRQTLSTEADAFAANVMPVIESLRSSGITDLRGLASALDHRGIRTARSGRRHVSSVGNVIGRAAP